AALNSARGGQLRSLHQGKNRKKRDHKSALGDGSPVKVWDAQTGQELLSRPVGKAPLERRRAPYRGIGSAQSSTRRLQGADRLLVDSVRRSVQALLGAGHG